MKSSQYAWIYANFYVTLVLRKWVNVWKCDFLYISIYAYSTQSICAEDLRDF